MAKNVGPIGPDEAEETKQVLQPDEVFETFNELITQHFSRGSAVVMQEDVVALLEEKGLDRDEIFAKGWLNVEEAYRAVGWQVIYDKPAYNESYRASFTFSRE